MNSNVHPFLVEVESHSFFVRIHPFADGNGRMARLILNLVLLCADYPPVIVPVEKKTVYFDALWSWDGNNTAPLTAFMCGLLHDSFDRYERAGLLNYVGVEQ